MSKLDILNKIEIRHSVTHYPKNKQNSESGDGLNPFRGNQIYQKLSISYREMDIDEQCGCVGKPIRGIKCKTTDDGKKFASSNLLLNDAHFQ